MTTGNSEIRSLYGVRTFDVFRVLRKPAYISYGWDFCDPLPNIGIWRDVYLEGRSEVVIDHLRLDTVIRGETVYLEGEVVLENVHPWSDTPAVLEIHVAPPQGQPILQHTALTTQVGQNSVACRIAISDPQLWWPNGMGPQPLYTVTARVICGNQESDRRTQAIGLRTITIDRSSVSDGLRFCIKVNGHDVFCKGANWAPADMIAARIDANRYQVLVQAAKDANFNMFRVNGVGFYEGDAFYEACDRAGILVWQDFTFSCALYPEDDEFAASVRHEASSVVKRLRHHPCLALWCGNNECLWEMILEWNADPTKAADTRGVRLYNEVLPQSCRLHDPVRPYWPTSPFGGPVPNSELEGDLHWYGAGEDFMGRADKRYAQAAVDACRARFVSEYGVLGPPDLASIREYLKPGEVSSQSTAFKIHTNMLDTYKGHGSDVVSSIREHYGDPERLALAQFVLYGQMAQAQLVSRVLEGMRFRKGDPDSDCQGALIWSFNDAWGEIGWSVVDYYARRKAGYYWLRRGAGHVKVLVRSRGALLVTRVVNDTRDAYTATVRCGWMRLDGRGSELDQHSVRIPANGMVEIARAPLPAAGERDPREWLYAALLSGDGFAQDQSIWLLAPHRELALQRPEIVSRTEHGTLVVSSKVYCHGVHLEDAGGGVLADNYFDLLPGVPVRIPIRRAAAEGYSLSAIMPIVHNS
jgi:beta-mannosidase